MRMMWILREIGRGGGGMFEPYLGRTTQLRWRRAMETLREWRKKRVTQLP
jgi:hypothetical protein